jgi:hypothetical protein
VIRLSWGEPKQGLPTLRSIFPGREADPRVQFKPWVRVAVTT